MVTAMKNKLLICVRYWLTVRPRNKLMWLFIGAISIISNSALMIGATMLGICDLALDFFNMVQRDGILFTLSLPFNRRELWHTHFLMSGVICAIIGLTLCIRIGFDPSSVLFIVMSVFVTNLVCALLLRSVNFIVLPAIPWVLLQLLIMIYAFNPMFETFVARLSDTAFLAGLAVADVALLVADILVWKHERQAFLKGGYNA